MPHVWAPRCLKATSRTPMSTLTIPSRRTPLHDTYADMDALTPHANSSCSTNYSTPDAHHIRRHGDIAASHASRQRCTCGIGRQDTAGCTPSRRAFALRDRIGHLGTAVPWDLRSRQRRYIQIPTCSVKALYKLINATHGLPPCSRTRNLPQFAIKLMDARRTHLRRHIAHATP